MLWRICAVLSAVAVVSCGGKRTLSPEKHVPGEDVTMPITIGHGLDHIAWVPKGKCVEVSKLETTSGASRGSSASIETYEIDSLTTLRKYMNVSASASLRFSLLGNPSGRTEMLDNYQHSQ